VLFKVFVSFGCLNKRDKINKSLLPVKIDVNGYLKAIEHDKHQKSTGSVWLSLFKISSWSAYYCPRRLVPGERYSIFTQIYESCYNAFRDGTGNWYKHLTNPIQNYDFYLILCILPLQNLEQKGIIEAVLLVQPMFLYIIYETKLRHLDTSRTGVAGLLKHISSLFSLETPSEQLPINFAHLWIWITLPENCRSPASILQLVIRSKTVLDEIKYFMITW
jgi:hypothetical protein